jgi:hypothetical protein
MGALVAAAFAVSSAFAAAPMEDWEHDWVALTVAQNGSWGAAANANLTRAMMQAIRDCARKSSAKGNDCGAEITTVRAAWSLAYACGEYAFISNGETPADARLAAIDRALDLKDILGFDLPPCALLVAVGADGRVAPLGDRKEFLSLPSSQR